MIRSIFSTLAIAFLFAGATASAQQTCPAPDGGRAGSPPSLPPCWRPISPFVQCVEDNGDGTFTAHWGYESENLGCCPETNIPVDDSNDFLRNYFSPAPIDRGQPTTFASGIHLNAFETTWDGSPLTWTLRTVSAIAPFYTEVSATASSDPALTCETPRCVIGGPYVVDCQGTQTSVTLDASASSDPGGRELTYDWTFDCSEQVTVTDGDTATPILTFTTPGQGQQATCNVQLTVRASRDGQIREQQSRCSTQVTVQPCELDCLGAPNGSAQLDQCGVCNGSNACLDCEGVPFGNTTIDRCGVCGGDGQSCLDCVQRDLSALLFALDGNANAQKRLVLRAARTYARDADSKRAVRFVRRARRDAEVLGLLNWNAAWSIPQIATTCGNAIFCTAVSTQESVDGYLTNSQALRRLAVRLARRIRQESQRPAALRAAKRYRAAARRLHRENLKATGEVPRSMSSCS